MCKIGNLKNATFVFSVWWEMVGSGGKWWEMVGKWWEFYQNIRNKFLGGSSMEHVRVNRRGGLDHGTLMCIY